MKKILAIALILFMAVPLHVQAQITALQYCLDVNSLAVYWLENISNQVPSGSPLINHNVVAFNAGNFNLAADFGASNTTKYLDTGNNLGWNGGNVTISLWVKINTEPSNESFRLAQFIDSTTTYTMLELRYADVAGSKTLEFGRTRMGIVSVNFTSPQTLGTTNWHHIVGTYNGSTGLGTLYLDNVSLGTFSQIGNGNFSGADQDNNFVLGVFLDGSNIPVGGFLKGLIDEVVVDSTVWSTTTIGNVFSRANPPIGCSAPPPPPPPAEGNLWQKRSFEGKGFIATTNEITITPAAETNFVLIKNPVSSGKLHRSNDFVLTVRTEGQNVRVRIYKNPTVTTDGVPVAVNNVRTSGNSPVSQVFTFPTTTLPGQLTAAFSRNVDSLNRSFDLSLYLEQGDSYLITVQGTAAGNDYMFTYTFTEE